jgi:hypothetical protein
MMAPREKVIKGGRKKQRSRSICFNTAASRPLPSLTSPVQTIAVTSDFTGIAFTTAVAAPTYYGAYFTLSSFADATQYQAVFDQYRFDDLEIWLESSVTGSSTVGSTIMFSAIDLDDANVPTSVANVASKQGVITSETTTGHYHRWKPHMALAAYSGAFTSYSNAPAGWIDCASPSVQHYGLKVAVPGFDGVARAINLTVRAKLSFRGPGI